MIKRFFWLLATAVIPTFLLSLFTTLPHLTAAENAATVLIDAVFYDGLETNEPDEAVRLRNVCAEVMDIGSWRLYDGTSTTTFPPGATLGAGQTIWVTKDSAAFARQFGFLPDFEVTDSNPAIPNLSGTWPGFANSGDEVYLRDAANANVDVLIYGSGDTNQGLDWSGTAVSAYGVTGAIFTT